MMFPIHSWFEFYVRVVQLVCCLVILLALFMRQLK